MTEEKIEKEEEDEKINKHDFYFETPLYDVISLNSLESDNFVGDVDAFSNVLGDNTTYDIKLEWVVVFREIYTYPKPKKGYAMITLSCKRKQNNILRFFVYKDEIDNKVVEKVGQDPSLADLQFKDLQIKYEKVLSQKYLKELKKAVGLASHGVGVGSFVYLRRIFENLIFESFDKNEESLEIPKGDFTVKKMEDKIDILKDCLPSQLVEMKSVYGILSKGVHQLEEDECLKYFQPLKLSIELILDQKIEEQKKKDKDHLVKKQIQSIQSDLKK